MRVFLSKRYVFVFLLLFTIHAYAQVDTLSTKSFEELEKLYLSTYTNPQKAKKYVDALLIVAKKGTNTQRIAKALYRKGHIYEKLEKPNEALALIDESLVLAKQIDDKALLLQNFAKKGNIYLNKGDYKQAITAYLTAKTIAEETQNIRDQLIMFFNVALVKKQIEDIDGAIHDFKEILQSIKHENDSTLDRLEVGNYLALADTYLRIQQSDSALFYTNKGLQKSSLQTFPELYTDLSLNKVIVLFQKKQFQKSIDLAVSVNKIIQNTSQHRKFGTSFLYQAKNYQALQQVDSTILYFEKFKQLADLEIYFPPELEEVYFQLAKIYLQRKDIEKATYNFDLFEKFIAEKDSTKTVVFSTIKDYDIASLKQELEEVHQERIAQKKTMNYLYVVSGILVGCVIFFFILYKQHKKKDKKRFDALMLQMKTEASEKKKEKTELAIDDEGVVEILKKLDKFEQQQYFLHKDCTLGYAAKKLKTNTAYLSHVINTYKGKKFTVYITELRVNAALVGLKNNSKIRQYSMEAIASEFGFKRRETFSKAFKNFTEMKPSSYIKQLQENDSNA